MEADPTPLGETLNRFLSNLGSPPVDVLSELAETWPEVVGPALATETWPIHIVDATLVVGCSAGAWASQVEWGKAQIQSRFQQLYPQVELVSVRVKVQAKGPKET